MCNQICFTTYQAWCDESESVQNDLDNTPPQAPTSELRRKMFALVRGDWNLAQRLLEQIRLKYPDRTESWYWEKVIYDLERDQKL